MSPRVYIMRPRATPLLHEPFARLQSSSWKPNGTGSRIDASGRGLDQRDSRPPRRNMNTGFSIGLPPTRCRPVRRYVYRCAGPAEAPRIGISTGRSGPARGYFYGQDRSGPRRNTAVEILVLQFSWPDDLRPPDPVPPECSNGGPVIRHSDTHTVITVLVRLLEKQVLRLFSTTSSLAAAGGDIAADVVSFVKRTRDCKQTVIVRKC